MVKNDIRTIQQRISAIESNVDGQSRSTSSIMGGSNKQATLRSRNNNQSSERLVRAVKVKIINSQVTTNGCEIDVPEPGTIAVNEIDTNSDTCCLGAK